MTQPTPAIVISIAPTVTPRLVGAVLDAGRDVAGPITVVTVRTAPMREASR